MNVQQKCIYATHAIHASQTASTSTTCTTVETCRSKRSQQSTQDSHSIVYNDDVSVNRANCNAERSDVKAVQVTLLDCDRVSDDNADRMSSNEYYQIHRNLFRDDDDVTAAVLQKQCKLRTPGRVHGKQKQQVQQEELQQPCNMFIDMSYLFCLLSPPPIMSFASWSEQSQQPQSQPQPVPQQQHDVAETTVPLHEVVVWHHTTYNDNTSTVSELCLHDDLGPEKYTEHSVSLSSTMAAVSASTSPQWSIVVPDHDCDAAYDTLWFKLMYMDGADTDRTDGRDGSAHGYVMLEGVELLEMLDVIKSKGSNTRLYRYYSIYFESGNAKVSILEEDAYAYFATMFAITSKNSDVPMKYRYEELSKRVQRRSRSCQLLFGTSMNRNVMNGMMMSSNKKHSWITELYGDV